MDLHFKVRRRIYHFTGLTRLCPIAPIDLCKCLNEEEAQDALPGGLFSDRYTLYDTMPKSLPHFYGGDRFMIIGNCPSDLHAIQQLLPLESDDVRSTPY